MAAALGASLVLHALMLVGLFWVWSATQPPISAIEPEPLQVELLDLDELPRPARAPDRSTVEAPPAPAARARSSASPPLVRSRGGRPARSPSEPAPDSPAPTANARDRDAAETSSLLRMRAPGSLDLNLSADAIARLVREGSISNERPPAVVSTKRPRAGLVAGAEDLRREAVARQWVQDGKVDPLFYDYLRDLEATLQPSKELAVELVRAHVGRDAAAGRWLGRYLGGFVHAPGQKDRTGPASPGEAFGRAMEAAIVEHMARVCVDTQPGQPPVVELARTSGVDRFDAIAVQALTRAVHRRPMDLVRGTGRACYGLAVRLTRVPPVPVLGCAPSRPALNAAPPDDVRD